MDLLRFARDGRQQRLLAPAHRVAARGSRRTLVDRRGQIGQESSRRRERLGLARHLIIDDAVAGVDVAAAQFLRSEEHTSELQSLMRISYAVFCLKKKIHIYT